MLAVGHLWVVVVIAVADGVRGADPGWRVGVGHPLDAGLLSAGAGEGVIGIRTGDDEGGSCVGGAGAGAGDEATENGAQEGDGGQE